MAKFAQTNFDMSLVKNLNLTPGVKRILIIFKMSTEGEIEIIKTKAPHIILQKEIVRVVKLLPAVNPQKLNKEITFALPISFIVK